MAVPFHKSAVGEKEGQAAAEVRAEIDAVSHRSTSVFYRRYGKRLLDFFASLIGLLAFAPLLLIISLAVKLGSRGPVMFRQDRVGRDRQMFKMWKFRSMVCDADKAGPLITASGDCRITPLGRYLRRWKLDELPQLWNVLVGNMSLVGPRPELAFYVRNYSPEQLGVLGVRPGITDLATLEYRNEEEILAAASDRERFYTQVVLPHKLELNLKYIKTFSLRLDLIVILMTLKLVQHRPAPKTAISEGSSSPI